MRMVKQLEKLYTILGLDKADVVGDIHSLATNDAPVTVSTQDADRSFKIPDAPIPVLENTFKLNEELIRLREQETQQVKRVLEDIFADDELEEEKVSEAPTQDSSILDALDDAHQKFLRHLLTQEKWERSGLHEFCKELGLMLDGAMETVNEWAFKNANALLIQDGEPICVDISLGKEILDGN